MALRNPLNRPMRTRMSGGVAGVSGRPLPLCRLPARLVNDITRVGYWQSRAWILRGFVGYDLVDRVLIDELTLVVRFHRAVGTD
jgi:hypothetical protein